MRTLGAILLVAACSPTGLTLEVIIDDPNIKKVELFAGEQCHPDCPSSTVPPGLPLLPVDDAFIVLDPQPFTVVENEFSDGVAGFRIEASQDTTLPILVVVAYDAQNEIRWSWTKHWVAIPDADSERWRIRLDPTSAIEPVVTSRPSPGSERIKLWSDPSGLPSCMLLEHWTDSAAPTRELLGPKDNTDCDNVTVNECAPWVPNAMGAPPAIEQASCVLHDATTAGLEICRLGGPDCTESSATPPNPCVALDEMYCVPSVFCSCASTPTPLACFREVVADATTANLIPHVKCLIRVDESGNRCDSDKLEIDLGPYLTGAGPGPSRTCKGIQLSDGDPLTPFNNYLHVGDGKLYVESFVEPCKSSASWSGGMAPLINFGLIESELDNGFHLLVPIRVELKPSCDNIGMSACFTSRPNTTNESIYNCAGPQSMTLACAPDTVAGCQDGPACGTGCCGLGEMCVGGMCQCGSNPRCLDGDRCAAGGAQSPETCGYVCCGQASGDPCPV